jgi:hypothetical protein
VTTYDDVVNDFTDAGAACPAGKTCYNTVYTYYIRSVDINGTTSGPSSTTSSEVAHLFVIADNQSLAYGTSPLPNLTFKAYGDVAGSLAPGSVTCTVNPVPRNAGSYPITCSGPATTSPADGVSYNVTYNNGTVYSSGMLTITPLPITVTATSDTKTYDGTTTSTKLPMITPALISGDTSNFTQAFDSRNVGARTLTPSGSANDGNGGKNYVVTPVSASGTINPAPLTIAAVANTKVYDGTISAAAMPSVSGLFAPDTVTGLAETYDTRNVGSGKTLSVSAYTVNDGNNGGNYTVTRVTNTAGVITPLPITATIAASDKTYDKTNTATITACSPIGVLAIDTGSVTCTGSAGTFASVNASPNPQTVTATVTLGGNASGNYSVTSPVTTTAKINPAPLTITALTNTKIYDGNTSAAAVPTASGLISPDTVTGLAETYDNANVGSGKTLSVSAYTVNDDNSGHNYSVTTVANATGAILWNFTLFLLKSPANLGSSVPTSWTLQNASGGYITDPGTLVKLESVFNGSTVPAGGCVPSLAGSYQTLYNPPNGATGNSSFRVVSNGFQFNWDSTTAAATGTGCYTVKITLNDGTAKMTNAVQLK